MILFISDLSFPPIEVDIHVLIPIETSVEITPIIIVIGEKSATDENAFSPAKLPTTTPSTVISRSSERLVTIIAGRYSLSLPRVRLPFLSYLVSFISLLFSIVSFTPI